MNWFRERPYGGWSIRGDRGQCGSGNLYERGYTTGLSWDNQPGQHRNWDHSVLGSAVQGRKKALGLLIWSQLCMFCLLVRLNNFLSLGNVSQSYAFACCCTQNVLWGLSNPSSDAVTLVLNCCWFRVRLSSTQQVICLFTLSSCLCHYSQ